MPRDPTEQLADLIAATGGHVTFDAERDINKPCLRCRRSDVPRTLIIVGHWSRTVYGGMRAGDAIRRPMCEACVKAE